MRLGESLKKCLCLVLATFSITTFATEATTAPGKIVRLHYWDGIDAILIIPENFADNVGCPKNGQYALSKSHPYFDELFSMILAAAASQADVQFTITNATCPAQYPYIKSFYYTP